MEIIQSAKEMQRRALQLKCAGKRIGFVPTMGFLHEGHLSLMRMARERCDVLVVSIFVNPAQFGPREDLEAYPRDFERDEELCRQAAVDLVFYPEHGSMYAADASVWVVEESLSGTLCGASRPGHFRGVCTVVAKLFNLVQPDIAVFGEKDAQQLRIIERMVRDLDFPVEIIRGPIIREPDGLAMSSRNQYLTKTQRGNAVCLKQALDDVRTWVANGERDVSVLSRRMIEQLEAVPESCIDYIEFVDDGTLDSVERIDGKTLVALAVRIGTTRLIDNVMLRP
ncbi:MAG TPA: pantoate--beta-alanine ligase [Pontiella sp.]